MEVPDAALRLDLVHEDNHLATGSDVFEAERKLHQGQPWTLWVLTVLEALVRSKPGLAASITVNFLNLNVLAADVIPPTHPEAGSFPPSRLKPRYSDCRLS
ncbi:hypothetical protein F4824DRAFT_500979 [Ustulina deusta]|nr:hypothetical protein F4824DRAFT_500979 [Ustulina deusta]